MPVFDTAAIGKRVRDARVSAGLTQAGLAEAAAISDETVSRIERGAYEPAVSTVVALADALGVSVDALTGRSAGMRSRRSGSPLVRRLVERVEKLDEKAVSALLQVALQLPVREPGKGRTRRGSQP
jgi:transcriptional regulator with XRE-family HTH domain